MSDAIFRVLFLCTGNSARSILAESLLNHWGGENIAGYSAGSRPNKTPHPLALELLNARGMPTVGLRSKSWDEFVRTDAPRLDLIITVCDNAAIESCPLFPGDGIKAHWGLPDPASKAGSIEEQRAAFMKTFRTLEQRISMLVDLPLGSLSKTDLKRRVQELAT